MNVEPVRTLIIDSHTVVREGLRVILGSLGGIEVVGDYSCIATAHAQKALEGADLVVLEPARESAGAVDAVNLLRGMSGADILVFTSIEDSNTIRAILRCGVSGFLPKGAPKADIAIAMKAVCTHRVWLHPMAQRLLMDIARGGGGDVEELTRREMTILELLCEGRANKDIGRKLALSEGTVKSYVSRIISKLGLADRTQVALYAVHHGLVNVSSGGRRLEFCPH